MYTDNDFIRFDWAAKYILRDKSDYEVFEGLMTVLIGEPIQIMELLESEINKETKEAKSNRVDIKASNIFYLVELAALISLMSTNLMCKGGSLNVISRFCLMMPVSLAVFMVCSALSI